MAWVAEVVKTADQALVVDSCFENFSRFCQPLLYNLAIAGLSTSGNRAAIAAQLLKHSESIASSPPPIEPETAESMEQQDHSIVEQLLADISRSLILQGTHSTESAVQTIRTELAAAAAKGQEQASPIAAGAPVVPQLPEVP